MLNCTLATLPNISNLTHPKIVFIKILSINIHKQIRKNL